jgi:hypothetical protein
VCGRNLKFPKTNGPKYLTCFPREFALKVEKKKLNCGPLGNKRQFEPLHHNFVFQMVAQER